MGAKIKKKIRFSVHSQCAWLGEIKVQHVLANKFAHAIGLFYPGARAYTDFHSGIYGKISYRRNN
jgi:hypothetical protein